MRREQNITTVLYNLYYSYENIAILFLAIEDLSNIVINVRLYSIIILYHFLFIDTIVWSSHNLNSSIL